MNKAKLATVWLDGCSGCHMSLLDMDAAIFSLARKIDLVYGPLVDAQEFPDGVDVVLVEGAVSSQDDLNKLLQRIYIDGAQDKPVIPVDRVPALLQHARPLREFVKVDHYLPGCPPSAKAISGLISDLLEGRKVETSPKVKFG